MSLFIMVVEIFIVGGKAYNKQLLRKIVFRYAKQTCKLKTYSQNSHPLPYRKPKYMPKVQPTYFYISSTTAIQLPLNHDCRSGYCGTQPQSIDDAMLSCKHPIKASTETTG
jgi:succinate dehydrogenase/fumarate reductase-like Fe-S protein